MMRLLFRSLKLAVLIVALVAIPATRPWQFLPPEWNPRAPLAVAHPPTLVTRWKLARLGAAPEQCLAVLETAAVDALAYLPLKDYTPVAGCPLSNVVRVQRTGIEFSAPFTLSCPLLVRWLMFEQQQLQPLAREHYGSPVASIDHYGTFACRNVYRRANGRRSQHATASAFDVAGFNFENGAFVTVLSGWDDADDPVGTAFLHDVHDAACRYFGTVLGPDYNLPHANHFHLDTSRFQLCR